jgi:hypothetical protein
MQELVKWPTAGDGYEDSGEGGLFALTARGQLLFHTYAQVFGVDPIILTFLDT